MTESMVEKVAMAIATARAGRENAEESRFKGGNLWFEAKRDARTAIEAMREPTDHMAYIGSWEVGPGGDAKKKAELKRAFTAMIDAALSPPQEPSK